MNKNDLRFQKTEIAIKSAYLALKKHGSAAVKVKELCDKAMINKTTFYAHYDTVETLHRQVCGEFVADILCKSKNIDKVLTSPRTFATSILNTFEQNMPFIEQLYGADLYAFVNDVEELFVSHYLPENADEDYVLSIRFCIGGAFKLLVSERDPVRIQKTLDLVERLLNPQ